MTKNPMTDPPPPGVTALPPVGRIEGVTYQASPLADARAAVVVLQYTDRTPAHAWHELRMPFLDAQYLLNLLEALSKESGFDHLRRAPGPPPT